MSRIFLAIDGVLEGAERRFGKGSVLVFVGFFFLLIAAITSAIRLETFYHGNGFTRLSLHPFEMEGENDLRYRILSPLLGYIFFMRGVAFKYFMLIILALFLGLIYFFQRKNLRPSEALGITAVCAFSTLTFYQLYFPAYTDPTSFLLVLLLMVYFRKKILGTILLSLMLFNHESTIFLFPFFFLLMADGNYSLKNIFSVGLKFLMAAVPYLIYRKYISMHSEVGFTISYYFDENNMKWSREHVIPHLAQGIFQAFRLAWILPIAALVVNVMEKRYFEIILIMVIIVFVLLQLAIAWDISRLTGLAFPAIIISAVRMQKYLGSQKFLLMIYAIVILNFFVPSYCIGALDPISYSPSWLK